MVLNRVDRVDISLMINYLLIGYAFVLPLSRAGIVFFTMVLILLWLVEGNYREKYRVLRQNSVVFWLGVFILFHFISLFWSSEKFDALGLIQRHWYLLPLVVFLTSLRETYISKVVAAFIAGMFVSEVISYGVFFELWEFKHATVENPSPFMHHIEYSVFLAFTALVLLGRILNEKEIKYKMFYFFFFATITGNLFLTAGRTGQLAFIVGLLVLVLANFQNRIKALFISLFLVIVVVGIAFLSSDTFQKRIITGKNNLVEVIEKENYCSSWGSRVGAWIVSKDMIVEHPVLGIGLVDNMKTFHTLIDTKYPEMACMHESFMHLHNYYLQVLTSLGIVGLILFLVLFYQISQLRLQNIEYRNMKFIYISIVLFALIPEVLLHRQFSMGLFALVIGLILVQHRIEHEI